MLPTEKKLLYLFKHLKFFYWNKYTMYHISYFISVTVVGNNTCVNTSLIFYDNYY